MMKFIFLVAAVIVLARPSLQLKCYNCRTDTVGTEVPLPTLHELPTCEADITKSPTKSMDSPGFPSCKKIIQKVTEAGEVKTVIYRFIHPNRDNVAGDLKNIVEYTCETDLCNSGFMSQATALTVLLSVATIALFH